MGMLPNDVSNELWIDEPKHEVLNEGYFRELRDDGIDGIAVMIDKSDRATEFSYDAHDVEMLLKLADPYAMETILTTWPYPSKVWMKRAFPILRMLCGVGPVAAVEGDQEFNWVPSMVDGFYSTIINRVRRSSLDLAGDEYVIYMDELAEEFNIRKEMTTFTSHTENGRAADVAPHMDCLLIQGYATRTRSAGKGGGKIIIPWDHTYGPGHMQKFTLDRTMLIPGVAEGRIEVGYGHALWNQDWPPDAEGEHTPDEAMTKSLTAALAHPIKIKRVRNWSSKHRKMNKYARPFLRTMR